MVIELSDARLDSSEYLNRSPPLQDQDAKLLLQTI